MTELVREARGVTPRVASVVVDHQWVVDCRRVSRLVVADLQLDYAAVGVLDATTEAWLGQGQEILPIRIADPEQLLADSLALSAEIAHRVCTPLTNVILAGPLAREQEMIDLIHAQVTDAPLSVASPGLCVRPAPDFAPEPLGAEAPDLLQVHRYQPTFKRDGHGANRRRWRRRSAI